MVTLANEEYSLAKNIDALMNTADVTRVEPLDEGDITLFVIQESQLLNSMCDPRGGNPEVALVSGPFAYLDDAREYIEQEYGSYPMSKDGGPNIYIAQIVEWRTERPSEGGDEPE
jgi:hypothetical protein